MQQRNDRTTLMFSIKPKWAQMIAEGTKRYELRRRPPPLQAIGKVALIYATAPQSEVICACRIDGILKEEREGLWQKTRDLSGCTKAEYDEYFSGCEFANAIHLTLLSIPLRRAKREELKRDYQFHPPQSWRWADELEKLIG